MNLYLRLELVTQTVNRGYDTYDSCVVAAENEESARMIRPDDRTWDQERELASKGRPSMVWADAPEQVIVIQIGETSFYKEAQLILASFNAG